MLLMIDNVLLFMKFKVRTGLKPGDLGYITYLHGKTYAKEYGFDTSFEPYVARPLSDFSLSKNPRQQIWILEADDEILGCVAILDAGNNLAQLRWLILDEKARGFNYGRALVDYALTFSREKKYDKVFLWTVDILEVAARIYKKFGFEITEENEHELWGRLLNEQRYELVL